MADLTLRPDLVERLQQIAEREQRPLDEVVESLLEQYIPTESPKHNPLLIMAQMAEADDPGWETAPQTNVAERSREILNTEFADYLIKRMQRNDDAKVTDE